MARCGHPGAAAPRHRESQDQARGKEHTHVCPWAGAARVPRGGCRPRFLLKRVSPRLHRLQGFPLFLMFSFNGNLLRLDFCHQHIFTNLSALQLPVP